MPSPVAAPLPSRIDRILRGGVVVVAFERYRSLPVFISISPVLLVVRFAVFFSDSLLFAALVGVEVAEIGVGDVLPGAGQRSFFLRVVVRQDPVALAHRIVELVGVAGADIDRLRLVDLPRYEGLVFVARAKADFPLTVFVLEVGLVVLGLFCGPSGQQVQIEVLVRF